MLSEQLKNQIKLIGLNLKPRVLKRFRLAGFGAWAIRDLGLKGCANSCTIQHPESTKFHVLRNLGLKGFKNLPNSIFRRFQGVLDAAGLRLLKAMHSINPSCYDFVLVGQPAVSRLLSISFFAIPREAHA